MPYPAARVDVEKYNQNNKPDSEIKKASVRAKETERERGRSSLPPSLFPLVHRTSASSNWWIKY
jgi:hypothetical protein